MGFRPNVFIDISNFVEKKIRIAENYKDEMGEHPFPRNVEALKALAIVRGASSGFKLRKPLCLYERDVSQANSPRHNLFQWFADGKVSDFRHLGLCV